ncbi:MAG: hypothetical protein R3C03_10405 [Pirellulaceae bacterium]
MNWKKRAREIAARNPGNLHPMLRQSIANASDRVYDRAQWHRDTPDVTANDAARPILVVLRWLDENDLLNSVGKRALKLLSDKCDWNAWLTSTMVLPRGKEFLDSCFEAWWSLNGPNLIMGTQPDRAIDDLDDAWNSYTSNENLG